MKVSVEEIKAGLLSAKKIGSGFIKRDTNPAAISTEEICALHYIFSSQKHAINKIAELGTYLGHTANILADLSSSDTKIEIYDFFEHNEQSIKSLKNHPRFSENDFFEVWKDNTKNYANKFELYKGDIRDQAKKCRDTLDLLFVDIVKHESIVGVLSDIFYNRLRIGGYLLHQDYYHWQSPWLVYQMEYLSDAFSLVGDFGNNMSIFVKTRELTTSEKNIDFVQDFSFEEKYKLMDQAITRYPGLRAGNLLASKLRLSIEDDNFDSNELYQHIIKEYDNSRIRGYAEAIMRLRTEITNIMW